MGRAWRFVCGVAGRPRRYAHRRFFMTLHKTAQDDPKRHKTRPNPLIGAMA